MKKLLSLLLVLLLLVSSTPFVTFAESGDEVINAPVMHSLTLATNGTGQGTITPAPALESPVTSYEAGTLVTLTAAAAAGSEFIGWSDGLGSNPVITVTMDASKSITATFNKIPNIYFTVDNEIKVFHNGMLISPVYHPTAGRYEWQRIKHYYVDNLVVGDIIAVEGTDQGVIAGFIGEIRINGVAYPTKVDSFWRQSEVFKQGWNAKNFSMDNTWGAVTKQTSTKWTGLVGSPTGFDADWVWSANNTKGSPTANHIVYFRYVVGGFPKVTFNSDGGNEIAPVTVTAGTTFNGNEITVPVPEKTGYKFVKWVLVNSTIEFNATYVINEDTQVIAEYTAIVPETPQPPTPPTPPTPQPPIPTEAPTVATQPTTEAATEDISDEAIAEGDANIFNFDSFIDESEATTEATEALEEVELLNEATPLADALPQTGQLPVELFYGVGGLITAAGVFLKKRK